MGHPPSSESVLDIFSLKKKTTPSVEYWELELVPAHYSLRRLTGRSRVQAAPVPSLSQQGWGSGIAVRLQGHAALGLQFTNRFLAVTVPHLTTSCDVLEHRDLLSYECVGTLINIQSIPCQLSSCRPNPGPFPSVTPQSVHPQPVLVSSCVHFYVSMKIGH